jgi:hypothetical protein
MFRISGNLLCVRNEGSSSKHLSVNNCSPLNAGEHTIKRTEGHQDLGSATGCYIGR